MCYPFYNLVTKKIDFKFKREPELYYPKVRREIFQSSDTGSLLGFSDPKR